MVETAMVLPWLFIFLFGMTEITLYLYSRSVVHYAAYMAARSHVVLKDKTLEDINYPSGSDSFKSTMSAEATAEKIIFESLPWEHKRIETLNIANPLARSYFDSSGESGAVRLKITRSGGRTHAEILYCLPLHFNLYEYFIPSNYMGPCSNITASDGSGTYTGIPIIHKVPMQENL